MVTAGVALAGGVATLVANAIQLRLARRNAVQDAPVAPDDSALLPVRASSTQRGGNLPRRYRPFVNRDSELREAIAEICNGRESVLAFEGAHGIGKSVAANELAHRLLEEPFYGAVDLREHEFIWVRGHNGCTTVADIGRSLSLETGDQSVSAGADTAKLDSLRAHLARHKTALVLDDLWLSQDTDSEDSARAARDGPGGINRDRGGQSG